MSSDLSEVVNIGIYDVDTEKVKYLQIDNVKDYVNNICWSVRKYIYVSVLNRDQNHLMLKNMTPTRKI